MRLNFVYDVYFSRPSVNPFIFSITYTHYSTFPILTTTEGQARRRNRSLINFVYKIWGTWNIKHKVSTGRRGQPTAIKTTPVQTTISSTILLYRPWEFISSISSDTSPSSTDLNYLSACANWSGSIWATSIFSIAWWYLSFFTEATALGSMTLSCKSLVLLLDSKVARTSNY